MLQVIVLYPQPANVQQFETDYTAHINFLHEKTGIPLTERPYTVTKFSPTPDGPAPFHLMFTMPFESPEALQAAMASPGMQEVSVDANRISTGGPITVLIGNQE